MPTKLPLHTKTNSTMEKQTKQDDEEGEETDEKTSKEPMEEENNNGESSSSSSAGKSGGGYSADCSASDDQSSDDTTNKPETVAMERLKLEEESKENEEKAPVRKHHHKHRSKKEAENTNPSLAKPPTSVESMEAVLNRNMAMLLARNLPLPQWNGITITNPMDPRIDLRNVNTMSSTHKPGDAKMPASSSLSEKASSTPSVENYLHLMEAVRPFFLAHGMPLQATLKPPPPSSEPLLPKTGNETSEPSQSEGFTSFFTTTDSNKTNTSPNSSDVGSKKKDSDDSSMVVHARAKRKHRKPEESSTSTSTDSKEKRVNFQDQPESNQKVPRIVTDTSSSSNKTDSNATTSGSGSGGNSGSNNTSSASGTGSGTGSGNDGKNSSEEVAEDESDAVKRGIETFMAKQGIDPTVMREQKLQDKKRKRIEMRREYEAQQFVDSSESSDSVENFLRPGRPVALDEVLVFSRIPRIVVQGIPPFLVIHTNAAYCRLTGIDSHLVVGKPINELLSIAPEKEAPRVHQEETKHEDSNVEATPMELAMAAESGRAEADREEKLGVTLDRVIASSGFGTFQVMYVHTKVHQMLGRSVSVVSDAIKNDAGQRDEESNNTSLTSQSDNEPPPAPITCRVAIAPVLSSSSGATLELDSQGNPKRLRLQTDSDVAKVHPGQVPPGVVTHFVLQMQPLVDLAGKNCSMESLSSRSAGPKLFSEQQREAVDGQEIEQQIHADASASASETTEPVAAVG